MCPSTGIQMLADADLAVRGAGAVLWWRSRRLFTPPEGTGPVTPIVYRRPGTTLVIPFCILIYLVDYVTVLAGLDRSAVYDRDGVIAVGDVYGACGWICGECAGIVANGDFRGSLAAAA